MALALLREAMANNRRPLLEEPVKTMVTVVAAIAGRIVGPDRFARLAGLAAGGRLVA